MTCDRSTIAAPTRPLVVNAARAVVTLLLYSYEVDRVRVLTDTRATPKSMATRRATELRSETLWTPEQTLLIVVTGVVGIARDWHRRLMLEPGLRAAPDLHHVRDAPLPCGGFGGPGLAFQQAGRRHDRVPLRPNPIRRRDRLLSIPGRGRLRL